LWGGLAEKREKSHASQTVNSGPPVNDEKERLPDCFETKEQFPLWFFSLK